MNKKIIPIQTEPNKDLLKQTSQIKQVDRFKDTSLIIYQMSKKFDQQLQQAGSIHETNGNESIKSEICMIL